MGTSGSRLWRRYVTWLGLAAVLILPAALAATLSLGGGPPTQAAVTTAPTADCAAAFLPTLGGRFGTVLAADQHGVAVGAATDAAGVSHPVRWRDGRPERLATGTAGAVAVATNARGEVIGTGRSDTAVGWVWSHGVTTRLKADADEAAVPTAINDRGVIVGALSENQGAGGTVRNENENEQAALWGSASAAPITLRPLPGDQGAHAFAVDNHGRVGGVSAGIRFRPVIWHADGRPTALPDLGGGYGAVRSLSDTGSALGDAVGADGRDHPVVWDRAGQITGLELPPGSRSGRAEAILGNGVIIGTAEVPVPGGFRTRAVRWERPDAVALLPTAPDTGSTAAGALDATTYVGYSTDAVGGKHPVIWRCRKE